MSAINQGKTLSSVAPGAEVSKNIRELASQFVEKEEKEKVKGRCWSDIFR